MKNRKNGFTLIEVLVTSAILVILAAGFLGIQYIFSKNQTASWTSYNNIEGANSILREFIREIRDARQSATGSYLLDRAEDNEIIFYCDYDYDSVVEKVRYSKTGRQIVKGVTEPSGSPLTYPVLNEKVKTLTNSAIDLPSAVFTYFNEDWPQDTENNPLIVVDRISQTKTVRMEITINVSENLREDYTVSSLAKIRTLD